MIKVMVVDDSVFMRKMITKMLEKASDIEIVAVAKNGKEAVDFNLKYSPDVITLDIEMPVMNGLEALEEIMKSKPTKVIMLSSLTVEGARETIKSLELGAFDFLSKPDGRSVSLNIEKVEEELLELVRTAASVNPKLLLKKPFKQETKPKLTAGPSFSEQMSKKIFSGGTEKIIAIGISTGGPKALQTIIPKIPKDINAGVLIVQHMPPKFTKSLAERLDELSELSIKEAEEGDIIERGKVYIAPGNFHMEVKVGIGGRKVLTLNQKEPSQGHRPSVDVMFDSVKANYKASEIISVIMTGMGKDGARAIKEIRNYGGKTIGESEKTCVVYGMPRVAAEIGGLDYVVDLEEIPNQIIKLLK
ncbi:MAG: chemotaxis response regulator protein-glutamate methylesterase [Fusobacteriaceae bacterium]|nr:chemotaxis response regulator protein-glutamate methylesterase [Fusobacteriaceae bacterium]